MKFTEIVYSYYYYEEKKNEMNWTNIQNPFYYMYYPFLTLSEVPTQRIHWKRASRAIHGLMLASPLRSVDKSDEKFKKTDASTVPLLRPQDLR